MPVIRYDNHPFTAVTKIVTKESSIPGNEFKTIKSNQPEIERSISFKNSFGIDLKMTGRTEESGMDVYKFWEDLKVHVPSFLASLPLPHSSAKRTTVIISYNPETSEVKEINFYLGVDNGIKKTKESKVTGPQYSTEEKIEKICSEFAAQDKASCTQQIAEKLNNVMLTSLKSAKKPRNTRRGNTQANSNSLSRCIRSNRKLSRNTNSNRASKCSKIRDNISSSLDWLMNPLKSARLESSFARRSTCSALPRRLRRDKPALKQERNVEKSMRCVNSSKSHRGV